MSNGSESSLTDWGPSHSRLTIARREVVAAVGGFDEGYRDDRVAMVDFSLRARQRHFACAYVGSVAFTCPGSTVDEAEPAAVERLRQKWSAYPQLFA